MSYYLFRFKKGDSILEAETQDTELLAGQFEKTLRDAFGIIYDKNKKTSFKKPSAFDPSKRHFNQAAPVKKPLSFSETMEKRKPSDVISKEFESFLQKGIKEEKSVEAPKTEIPKAEPPKEIQPEIKSSEQEVVSSPEISEIVQDPTVNQSAFAEETTSSFQEIPTEEFLLQENIEQENKAESEFSNIEKTISNISENIDTVNPVEFPRAELTTKDDSLVVEEPVEEKSTDFYNVLQQKVSAVPETPEVTSDEIRSFDDLVRVKSPATTLDYLILTAYYLKYYENMDKYSLKQINLKVLPLTKVPVNHSVIQEAVSLNYLEVVPDYTGTSYITEYVITDQGALFVTNEL